MKPETCHSLGSLDPLTPCSSGVPGCLGCTNLVQDLQLWLAKLDCVLAPNIADTSVLRVSCKVIGHLFQLEFARLRDIQGALRPQP